MDSNPLVKPSLELLEAWAAKPVGAENDPAAYAMNRLFIALEDNWPTEYQAAFKRGLAKQRKSA